MNQLSKDPSLPSESKQIKKLKKALAKALVLAEKQQNLVESLRQLIIKTEDAQAPITHPIVKHREYLCIEVGKTGLYVFANNGCKEEKLYKTTTLDELDQECLVTDFEDDKFPAKPIRIKIPIASLLKE